MLFQCNLSGQTMLMATYPEHGLLRVPCVSRRPGRFPRFINTCRAYSRRTTHNIRTHTEKCDVDVNYLTFSRHTGSLRTFRSPHNTGSLRTFRNIHVRTHRICARQYSRKLWLDIAYLPEEWSCRFCGSKTMSKFPSKH